MPILKDIREAKSLTTYQNLPPSVQEKVCQIEVLYDRAILYLEAKKGAPAGVSDFKAYLKDIYENRIKGAQEEHEDEPLKVNTRNAFYLGLDYEYWIEILADSRYDSPPDLVHHAMMFFALWIYWMNWPNSRRIFKEENENQPWYAVPAEPAPPSAPSFEAALDRSLVWLALSVGIETANIRLKGIREGNRTAKSTQGHKKIKAEKDQLIIKTFNGLQFPKEAFPRGVSLHKVADMIKNNLAEDEEFHSIDKIKRVLRKDEEVWKQFTETKIEGKKYFIKQV
jgi:hypothetical protein